MLEFLKNFCKGNKVSIESMSISESQLTKRDEYAKAALQGLLSNPNMVKKDDFELKQLIEHAVVIADTIVAKLEKTN